MIRSPLLLSLVLALALGTANIRALGAISEAHQQSLAEAFALFKKGAYSQAVEKAESITGGDQETQGAVAHFVATAYAKLQSYEKAAEYFEKTRELKYNPPGLHYDYGQALFALQRLKDAEKAFRRSIISKFKMGASAYYIAFIRQTLDDRPGAKDFYNRIGKLGSDPDQVKQASLLQIAEISKEEADAMKDKKELKTKRKRLLETEVTSLFKRARDYSPGTDTAAIAEAKLKEIDAELESMVERMRNGNPLPRQAYSLVFSQDLTYDSNVITQADQALVQVSNKDALIWKTGFLTKYQFNWRQTVSFIPELNASISYHSRRTTGSVFQNDNISISPALRTKIEHWSAGKPATMLLEFEFNYMLRDYRQAHQFPFYSRHYNFVFGERVKWFGTGSTTFKVNIKFLENNNPERNSYSPGVSLTQLVKIGANNLVNTLSADYLHARNDFNDERNYKLRSSITFPKFIEKVDFTPSVSLTLKDTMKQKGSRGNELMINPSLAFNREITSRIDGTFDYAYTKNFSSDKSSYQYTKQEFHLGASYRF